MRIVLTIVGFVLSLTTGFGQTTNPKLTISPLTGDFYVFVTYNTYQGTSFPANAMYLVTDEGVVLFDTPWDTTQFQRLLDSIKIRHNKNVVMCLATHFHKDRTVGLDFFRQKGVKTYTTKQTDAICKERDEKRAEFLIEKDTVFSVGRHQFQTYYSGPGHSPDNIVVWFDKEKILYGGCLIKSVDASDLGNLADANVNEWGATIHSIQRKFKNPRFIITGHQDWTSKKSLDHTLTLLKQLKDKEHR